MNLKYTLLGLLGIMLISCSPKYYSPNTQNVPLIHQKNETSLSISGNTNQIEFQGAYGVTKNIAIQGNGGLFIPSDLENGNGGSGKFIEVGTGYFKELKPGWIFESYVLGGIGSFENHLPSTSVSYPGTNGDISANIWRIGIQPNFGYKSKYFSSAISARVFHLQYYDIQGDLVFEDVNQVEYIKNNASNFMIEPSITIRGGLEKVKLQLQYGLSLNISEMDFKQDKSYLTFGLHFNFE